MPTPRPAVRRSAAALLLALAACGGSTPDPECATPADCPRPASACQVATCAGGACGTGNVAAGSVVGAGTAGDCRREVCDGQGVVISVADDADAPASPNACAPLRCGGGAVQHPVADPGTPCAQDGGAVCDGAGACVQCLVAAQCPGHDGECGQRTCLGGICGRAEAPGGTRLVEQVDGDCRAAVCNGLGGITSQPDDADAPAVADACVRSTCVDGTPQFPPSPPRTACAGPGGAALCDGAGNCVQCTLDADCPASAEPCQVPACVLGTCALAQAPAGTPAGDPRPGDCHREACDAAGAVISVPYDADPASDGNQCTADVCVGGTNAFPPAAPGTPCSQGGGAVCDGAGQCVACNVGADCTSGVCAAHRCAAPSCADTVLNGGETDVDCGGATACARCAVGLACAAGTDCQSGACAASRCAAPSCGDQVRNGSETDVDCGGTCGRCNVGFACSADADCTSGSCGADHLCRPSFVAAVTPADGAGGVAPGTVVTLQFSQPPNSGTVNAQAAAGPCSGSVQLSTDDFATCLGATVVSGFGSGVAVLQPAVPLAGLGTVRLRVTSLVSTSLGPVEPYTSPAGFTLADTGRCGSALVVSQVYPGGGLPGALFARDFVEIHNRAAVPVNLAGLSVQAATTGSGWQVTPLAGTIQPGGYLLVQLGGGPSGGNPLPAPDATSTFDLPTAGGRVAVASTPVAMPIFCGGGLALDLVGYGTSGAPSNTPVGCFEGTAGAPAPADGTAALVRAGAGCADGNGNRLDLASQLAVPRTSASPPTVCGCNGLAMNGTGLTVEMDACFVQAPASLSLASGAISPPVFGRVFEPGVTGQGATVLAGQVGYGPAGTDPRWAAGWTFLPASFLGIQGGDDEFQAALTAPSPGGYAYVYRFSPDGTRWTYCDADGAGSSPGLPFSPGALPPMTVTP